MGAATLERSDLFACPRERARELNGGQPRLRIVHRFDEPRPPSSLDEIPLLNLAQSEPRPRSQGNYPALLQFGNNDAQRGRNCTGAPTSAVQFSALHGNVAVTQVIPDNAASALTNRLQSDRGELL